MAFLALRGGRPSAASDTTPDAFCFTAQTGVAQSFPTTSNTITPVGYDTTASISVSGGLMSVNGDTFSATTRTITPGNTLALRLTSSASYSTLATATATIGGATSGSFDATTLVDPAGAPPLLAPSASWTGVGGTGGTAPTPSGTGSANPTAAARWFTPPLQRLTANTVIGIDAGSLLGVASVSFWVEGTTQAVARSVYTYNDVNGVSRSYDGYWITLNVVAAAAAHTGDVHIYATAAGSGAIQSRCIGPLVLKPRSTAIVWSKTVRADGTGDYTTIAAARAAFLVAAPESGEIIVGTPGATATYDLPVWTDSYTGHTGYFVIRAAAGANSTLTRGTSFTSTPTGNNSDWDHAWAWMPFCGIVEFRGAGIIVDIKNWVTLFSKTSEGHWFNGCTITNSAAGGRDQLTWNKAPHPGFATCRADSGSLSCYYTDVTTSHLMSGIAGEIITGLTSTDGFGNHDNCKFIVGTNESGVDPSFFATANNAISMSYSGAGTFTVVANVDTRTLDCKINGTSVGGLFPLSFTSVFRIGQLPSDTYYQMSAVVTALNTIANVTATLNDGSRAGISILRESYTQTITSSASFLTGSFPYHTEWINIPNGMIENVIHRNCKVTRSYWNTAPFNGGLGIKDGIVDNMIFETTTTSFANGGIWGNHLVMTNCYYDSVFPHRACDAYSLHANNIFNTVALASTEGGVWPTTSPFRDNAVVGTLPTGTGNTGNFAIADMSSIVRGKTTGDFRPTLGGTLLANLKAKIGDRDVGQVARAANDVVGPVCMAA